MAKFIKKAVVIDAIRWEGGDYKHVEKFCGLNWGRADAHDVAWTALPDGEQMVLWNTMECQWLLCPKGHWIIRGLQGELYPCDPNIFEDSYAPLDAVVGGKEPS